MDAISSLRTNGSNGTILVDDILVMAVTRSDKQTLNHSSNEADESSHTKISSSCGNNLPTILKFIGSQRKILIAARVVYILAYSILLSHMTRAEYW